MKRTADNSQFLFRSFGNTRSIIIVIYFTCSPFFLVCTKSETHIVGDDKLWTDSTAYDSWSHERNFTVGDILEFKYTIGLHNVYEVTQKTYRSCDLDYGYLAKHESGDDRIQLKEARSYWFLCGIDGHCLGGQRFGIKVVNGISDSPAALSPQIMKKQPDSSATRESSSGFCLDCRIAGIFMLQACILLIMKVVL